MTSIKWFGGGGYNPRPDNLGGGYFFMKYFSLSPGFATAPMGVPPGGFKWKTPLPRKKRPAPPKTPFPQLKVFSRPAISPTDTVFKSKRLKIFRRLRRAKGTWFLIRKKWFKIFRRLRRAEQTTLLPTNCVFVPYVRGKILVNAPPLEKNAVANPVTLTLQRYFKLYLWLIILIYVIS